MTEPADLPSAPDFIDLDAYLDIHLDRRGVDGFPRRLRPEDGLARPNGRTRVFELAAGLTMLIEFAAPRDVDDRALWAEAIDRLCKARVHAPKLLAWTDIMRMNLRRLISLAVSRGLRIEYVRVDIADLWDDASATDIRFTISVDILSANLRTERAFFTVASIVDLERQFNFHELVSRARVTAVDALASVGADGMIDAIALNALRLDGGLTMKTVADTTCHRLSSGMILQWHDGHLALDGTEIGSRLRCRGDMLRIPAIELPATACIKAIGRPIVELVSHPLLTAAMVVSDVVTRGNGRDVRTLIRISQTIHLLRLADDAVWPASPADFHSQVPGNDDWPIDW